ncbi:hypothetical protein GCM10009740_24460 [Terrabacter terrae]|uniref:Mce-associated membrane protein n=1 Tax=Terrabacter terrae TaxID=318434 RepID=A0ABP5FWK1_9MICO
MTSSADPRRTAPAAGSPRKRVAGTRRRSQSSSAPAEMSPVAPAGARTGTATLERPAVDAFPDEELRVDPSDGIAGRDPEEPVADDADARDALEQRRPGGAAADAPARRSTRLWPAIVAAVLATALLGATLVYALRPTVSEADRTAAASSARTTLESLLSYSGSSFDKHVDEVLPQLTSPFKDQFTKVAATDIKPMAVKNAATVQAKVYEAGVMDASGDGSEGTTVRVMAFVNQATTTKAQPAPAIDQNRVIATMRKTGDRWLVSDLAAY